jgi:hypothetical protein
MTPEEQAAHDAEVAKKAQEEKEAADKKAADKKAELESMSGDDLLKLFATLNFENAGHRKALEKLEKQAADAKAAQAKIDQEMAEKGGEFEKLYGTAKGELDTIKGENATLKTTLQTFYDSQVAEIPDNVKALMPEGLVEGINWLANAKATNPGLFSGDGVETKAKLAGQEQDVGFQEKYDALMKSGDMTGAIALKNAHFAKTQ